MIRLRHKSVTATYYILISYRKQYNTEKEDICINVN